LLPIIPDDLLEVWRVADELSWLDITKSTKLHHPLELVWMAEFDMTELNRPLTFNAFSLDSLDLVKQNTQRAISQTVHHDLQVTFECFFDQFVQLIIALNQHSSVICIREWFTQCCRSDAERTVDEYLQNTR
jgi:hypothetical protein